MKHLLPSLPYDCAALEPHIDARTMRLHHDKHHAAYVANLNAALEKFPALQISDLGVARIAELYRFGTAAREVAWQPPRSASRGRSSPFNPENSG